MNNRSRGKSLSDISANIVPQKNLKAPEQQVKPEYDVIPSLISEDIRERISVVLNLSDKYQNVINRFPSLLQDEKSEKLLASLDKFRDEIDFAKKESDFYDDRLREYLFSLLTLKNQDDTAFLNLKEIKEFASSFDSGTFMKEAYEIIKKNSKSQTFKKMEEVDWENLSRINASNKNSIVNDLVTNNKINNTQANELLLLAPKTETEQREYRDSIIIKLKSFDLVNGSAHAEKLMKMIENQEKASSVFNDKIDEAREIGIQILVLISELEKKAEFRAMQEKAFRDLEKKLGGKLLAGTTYVYDKDNVNTYGAGRTEVKIISIDYRNINWDETDVESESEDPLLPAVKFEWRNEMTQRNGEDVLSAQAFVNIMNEGEYTQKVESKDELEEILDLSVKMERGQVFEFMKQKDYDKEKEMPIMENIAVTIESVENGFITLDKEIEFLPVNKKTGRFVAEMRKTLSYGDFLSFYLKNSLLPKFDSLSELNKSLRQRQKKINKSYNRDKKEFPPIVIKPPFPVFLHTDDEEEKTFRIIDADDEKIVFDGGEELPLSGFLRWVDDNNIEAGPSENVEGEKTKYDDSANKERIDPINIKHSGTQENPPFKSSSRPRMSLKKYFLEDTVWLDLNMFFELGKQVKDMFSDMYKKRSQKSIGTAGERLFKGIPLLERLVGRNVESRLSVDSEEVKKIAERMKNIKTPLEMSREIYSAKTANQLKAYFTNLSELGMIRWEEDEELWKVIHKLLPTAYYPESFGENIVGKKVDLFNLPEGVFTKDALRIILDEKWGDGTFDDFYNRTLGKYNEKKENSGNNFHNYEFLQGGVKKILQQMLQNHIDGSQEVDATVFDGLLERGMSTMEFSFEDSLMFFITALGTKNKKTGKTLIPVSRFYQYTKANKGNMAFIFFALGHPQYDENGNPILKKDGSPKKGKLNYNNFKKWYENIIKKDISYNASNGDTGYERFKAGPNMLRWLQTEVLDSPKVRYKISSGAAKSEADIMLYHHIGPMMTNINDLDSVLKSGYQGRRNLPLLKNMYAGYNNQLKIRAENLAKDPSTSNVQIFAEMLSGFTYFDLALKGQIYSGTSFMKMQDNDWESFSEVDDKSSVRAFSQNTMEFLINVLTGICQKTTNPKLSEYVELVLKNKRSINESEVENLFNLVQTSIKNLAKTSPNEIAAIVANSNQLIGMSLYSISKKEQEEAKIQEALT